MSNGQFLAEARRRAGLSELGVVAQTTLSQVQLSGIERGQAMPTVGQARALGTLYRLNLDDAWSVIQAVIDRTADKQPRPEARGQVSREQRIRDIEEHAAIIRGFSPTMVLGQLRTPAYIAAVVDQPEHGPEVQDQLRLAVDVPHNRSRMYTLLLGKGAARRPPDLRWPPGSAALMAEQLDHLITVSQQPNVRLGLISSLGYRDSSSRPAFYFSWPAFYFYDDHLVLSERRGGVAHLLDNPADLSDYRDIFEHFEQLATFGEPVRDQLREIAADYRRHIPT